jgi:hypothetical protein
MHPAPIGVALRTGKKIYETKFWRTVSGQRCLLAEGDIGANIHIDEQFGASRLFSYQSPIIWALQTGNGNTSKKRRRQH